MARRALGGEVWIPPQEKIEEMLAFLAEREPVGNAALASYDLTDVVNCPNVMELASHPRLLALAGS